MAVKAPIWKDTNYTSTASTLGYSIFADVQNEYIHSGYSKAMPGNTGVTLNINNRVDEYLNPEFGGINNGSDLIALDNNVVPNPAAYNKFILYDDDAVLYDRLETYYFLYDWTYTMDWSGQSMYNMSEPVNGHVDPRMKLMDTMYNTASTVINHSIDYKVYAIASPKFILLSEFSGHTKINIESKGSWTAKTQGSSTSWLTLTPMTHSGNYITDHTLIDVEYQTYYYPSLTPNINPKRTVNVLIWNPVTEDVYDNVRLIQPAYVYQPEVIIYDDHIFFNPLPNEQTVQITSNMNLTASTDASWITLSTTAFTLSETAVSEMFELSFTANSNTASTERVGYITVTDGMSEPKIISVTQEGYVLSLSPSSETYGSGSGTSISRITTTVPFTASTDVDWLSIVGDQVITGNTSMNISLFYEINSSGSPRDGHIVLNGYGGVTKQYTYTQDAMQTGDYVTFTITSPGNILWNEVVMGADYPVSAANHTIYYKKNDDDWTQMPSSLTVTTGDEVKFKGVNNTYTTLSGTTTPGGYYINTQSSFYGTTAGFKLSGDIMTLEYGDYPIYTFPNNSTSAFTYVFAGCTNLTDASGLTLPATTLAKACYEGLFQNCSSLVYVPSLTATTLANDCYMNMFRGCTSLSNAPSLPATIMRDRCYNGMFWGCTSLTIAPELPATTLATECYYYMFYNTSLITAPVLPATTLADACYGEMFANCDSLVNAPELPATTLAEYCYVGMFSGCDALTVAPELPATTLAYHCYDRMFENCDSLTTAPDLLVDTEVNPTCYREMFLGCNNLNYVKCLAAGSDLLFYDWLYGVSPTGTFVKANDASWRRTSGGIPSGWTVVDAS